MTRAFITTGDYDFNSGKGNAAFDEFLKDGVWNWIKPAKMIDTNCGDDGIENDRYPDSILEFNFVTGAATTGPPNVE